MSKVSVYEARIIDIYDTVKRIEREINDVKRKLDSIERRIGNIERGGRPPPETYI